MQYRQKARLEAKELIKKSIGKKPLESLEPEFWDKLTIDMLTIDGRRPHPKADVRYELLLRWQTAVAHTAKLRLKRVIILNRSFDSVLTVQSIGTEAKLKNLKTWFAAVVDQQPLSKSGIRHCLALATLDLAITCQMTAPQILTDILQKKNIRLVLVVDAAYLEHHPLLDEYPSAPVTRYRISRRCAQWLDKAMQSTITLEMTRWEMPEAWLTGLPTMGVHRSLNVTALIRKIAAVVQQANYLQRPGLVAGYLAGVLPTSALPHRSWVLQDHQVILESTPSSDADRDVGTNEDAQTISVQSPVALFSSKAKISSASKANDSDAQRAARIYIGSLTDLLNGFIRQSNDQLNASETYEQLTNGARQARRELVTALSRQVKANQETVSSAIWALGHWVVYLTQVPRKKNTPYAITTVLRYLSSLSWRFIEMGCHFNLIGADSEEITDFYDEVLEIDRDLDLRYVVERLNAFHRYMQFEFKIEDADWDELDCGAAVPHGSPGTLGLDQYANALELLAPIPESATHHELASAFLLLLTFRFGLRAADAKGLKFEDFWLHDKMIVIHVQSNELRKLKRPASRRVVPLIEEISDFEWTVIHQFIDRAGLCRPDYGSFALFAINAKANRFDMRDLSARINHVLKRVCADPNISHYKGRHAFANRISQALIGRDVSCSLGGGGKESNTFFDHVAKLLLGTTGPTRRAAWALARLMGHARPRTSFKSYVHLLPIWSDSWSEAEIITLDQKCLPKPLRCALALNVESSQSWQAVHEVVHAQSKEVAVTPAVILSYLRLLRRGADVKAAARFVGISPELTDRIQKLLIGAESRIRSRTERAGRAPMQSLLNLISHAEWQTISTGCDEVQDNSVSDSQPLDLDQAIGMVSENRQLVMWKELHFQQVGEFVQYFKLAADVKVLKTTNLHPVVADWLVKYIPAELTDSADPAGRVDPVEEGVPPQQVKSRCAVIISFANEKPISTGYGLVLLWVIYQATISK